MYIEKLSDTQIKFTIEKSDLFTRNMSISDMAYGSLKMQDFFRYILQEAKSSCGFNMDNDPLIVEIVPLSDEDVIILITKISVLDSVHSAFKMLGKSEELPPLFPSFEDLDFMPPNLDFSPFSPSLDLVPSTRPGTRIKVKSQKPQDGSPHLHIYSFNNLDCIITLSKVMCERDVLPRYNSLYKLDDFYFLIIDEKNRQKINSINLVCSEFSDKHYSNNITKSYLIEHGELIIKKHAIQNLSNI